MKTKTKMNNIEEIFRKINMLMKEGNIDEETYNALYIALQVSDKDNMRCENCSLKDTKICRASYAVKYDIKKGKNIIKTIMEEGGFCSRFEPKESKAEG